MSKDFGEFKTVEELNLTAEGLKEEGDLESLIKLAEENGLDREDAIDYFEDVYPEFTNVLTAAIAKIELEKKALNIGEILEDWANFIKIEAQENEKMAAGVMMYSLSECIAELLKYSFKNVKEIPKEISKAAGITNASVKLGIPGQATAKRIIREFYTR